MKISVVGLGKLGLCTATCFAARGNKVIGFDNNIHLVNELLNKRCPIDETALPELLKESWDNLTVTTDMRQVVMDSDITLIIVPTPSNEDGRFSNKFVETVLREMAPYLKEKKEYHIVDVVSTVMPGSCENEFKPLLEELTGKLCGKDFGLVYNPEFIALGSIIKNFLNPDMVLIGASDEYSGNQVKNLYLKSCDNSPYIAKMSLINAEITKISLNCYVTMKISFANEISSICEKVHGADVDVITSAIGADSRIGNKYLKGGLGFGGPCFPRDNIAFQRFANEFGAEARLGKQVVAINDDVVERLVNIIDTNVKHGKNISLLGLSYKPDTHIIEESQSIMLAKRLIEKGYVVTVHDPKALDEAKKELGDIVKYVEEPHECLKDADAIVLLTNWNVYNDLNWSDINKTIKKEVILVDCWRMLKNHNIDQFEYITIGRGGFKGK